MDWAFSDTAPLLGVVGINLILSCDNLLAAGLATRNLPGTQRNIALLVGITSAVVLQGAATLMVASLLRLALVSCIAGILLIWIAIRLQYDGGGNVSLSGGGTFLRSILTVTIAYLLMCADNILAIAAIAQNHPIALILGLLLSCLLLIPGSLLVAELMRRYPLLVTGAAALLGWTAGKMLVPGLALFGSALESEAAQMLTPIIVTIVVVTSPLWWRGRNCAVQVDAKPIPRH